MQIWSRFVLDPLSRRCSRYLSLSKQLFPARRNYIDHISVGEERRERAAAALLAPVLLA